MKREEFKKALEKRLVKRLKKMSFDAITVGGSKMRFDMELAINGYPFDLPEGAVEGDYEPLLTDDQYMSGEFDDVVEEVFNKAFAGGYTT